MKTAFVVFEAGDRHNTPVAVCASRHRAEKVIEELGEAGDFTASTYIGFYHVELPWYDKRGEG